VEQNHQVDSIFFCFQMLANGTGLALLWGRRLKEMKTKLIGVMALLAGSALFAAPRVVVGLGVGVPLPAYGYGYVAPPPPPPVYGYAAPAYGYAAPVTVGPQVWVNGFWGAGHVWHPGYYGRRPVYRGGFRR
jgi:hypothetical protein